jgi:hypothetical protein
VQAALFGGVEDELLGGVVDVGCALQQGGAGDAETVQGVLDRAGQFAGLDREGWFAGGLAREGWAGIAAILSGGSGGGQHLAGCSDGCGRLAGVLGGFGGGFSGVLAEGQQCVAVVAQGGREGGPGAPTSESATGTFCIMQMRMFGPSAGLNVPLCLLAHDRCSSDHAVYRLAHIRVVTNKRNGRVPADA